MTSRLHDPVRRTRTQFLRMLAVSLVLSSTVACESTTYLFLLTDTPPGRVASVDVEANVIQVSEGVAVGLECYWYGYDLDLGWVWEPCASLRVELADEEAARVLPALFQTPVEVASAPPGADPSLPPGQLQSGSRTGVVLIGERAGTTTLEVQHARDTQLFSVVIDDVSDGG